MIKKINVVVKIEVNEDNPLVCSDDCVFYKRTLNDAYCVQYKEHQKDNQFFDALRCAGCLDSEQGVVNE